MHKSRFAISYMALSLFLAAAYGETRQQTALSYVDLGEQFASHGDSERAIKEYTIALQFDSDCAPAFFHRGQEFEKRGDVTNAIEDYGHAVNLRPSLSLAWYNRGNLRFRNGDFDGALSDFDKAIEHD